MIADHPYEVKMRKTASWLFKTGYVLGLLALAAFGSSALAEDLPAAVTKAAAPSTEEAAEKAAPTAVSTGPTVAKQAIIIDYDTGMTLLEKNPDEKMPTSSMSKTMTVYLVFQALKEGKLKLDDTLPVSEKAWRMEGSKMFIEVGKQIKVEDLIQGVIVQSGNDATVALAEGIAGTEEAFADRMNTKAESIGMSNSHFMNASGWPDPDHYSTARDLSTLAVHLIRDFPEDYKYYSEKEFTYNNIRQPNRNPLLYRNIGADGIKTGHTEGAGYGLMGSGARDGRRVVMVLNGLESEKVRAEESARLLDWALRSFENVKIFAAGETVEEAPVVMGKSATVPLVIQKDLNVTVPVSVKNDLKVEVAYKGPLQAPVKKGQQVGVLRVDSPRIGKIELPLIAGADVGRIGFFAGTIAKARLMLDGRLAAMQ